MTGYTAEIENGPIKTGKEFLTLCCQAFVFDIKTFGADMSTEKQPSSYYENNLKMAEHNLEEAKKMSIEDAATMIKKESESRSEECKLAIRKLKITCEKYSKIKEEIIAWLPPTPEHTGLKKFALGQIDQSMPDQSVFKYYEDLMQEKPEDPKEYLAHYILECEERLDRAKKMYREELESVKKVNNWIKDFRDSFQEEVIPE